MKKIFKILIFVLFYSFSQISFGAPGEGIRFLPYGTGYFAGVGGSLTQIKIITNGAVFTSGSSAQNVFSGGNDIVEARIYELNGQIVNCNLTGFANGMIGATNCFGITKNNNKGYYVSFVTKFGNFGAVGILATNSNSNSVSNNSMEVKGIVMPYISISLDSNIAKIGTGGIMDFGNISLSQSGTNVSVTTNAKYGYNLFAKSTNFTDGIETFPFQSASGIFLNPNISSFGLYIDSIKNPSSISQGFNKDKQTTQIIPRNGFGLGNSSTGIISNDYQMISSSDGNLLTGSILIKYITGVSQIQSAGTYSSSITFRAVGNF